MKIAKNITELVGNTPLVKLSNYAKDGKATILAKLESFNPMSSVKDRIALAMIVEAEKNGLLDKDTTIVEATSGNTGIGLAYISAQRGYDIVLTMPDTMTVERQKLLKALGAKIELTEGSKGMKGAIAKADEIASGYEKAFRPRQFENEANPKAHYYNTAEEIYIDTDGKVDIMVCGVGTGGTITGTGSKLKEYNKDIKVVAVEPSTSAVLSGEGPGPHKLQGIGAGFVPSVLDTELIDDIIKVDYDEAVAATRSLAKNEGILVGISSGAAAHAASVLASRAENAGKNIVVVFPDTGERYLSTALFEL